MKEEFEKLNKERKINVEKSFANADGKDQFFLHILDGFSHRYITDQKQSQAEIQIVTKSIYKAFNKLETMKRALELVGEGKADLIEKMKQAVGSFKPTTLLQIQIDASGIDSNGQGIIRSECLINWDFPKHSSRLEHKVTHQFQSKDWDHLRKLFPLSLDELCEVF